MSYHESFYQILKTSWGIRVLYNGEITVGNFDNSSIHFYEIEDNIFMCFQLKGWSKAYFEQCKKYIENGIKWALSVLTINEPLYIIITEIDFNFCDFQIEGLFFGAAYWLTSYFNTEMPKYNYRYDRALNKYFFEFEESDKTSIKLLYPEE